MEQRAPPTEPAYVKSSFTALGEGAMAAPIDLLPPIAGPPPGLPPVCPQPAAHKAATNSTASSEQNEVGEAAEELASAALQDMAMGMPGWNAWAPYAHDVHQMGLYSVCGPNYCWPYPPYGWPPMYMGAGVHPPGFDGWTAMETVEDVPVVGGLPPPPPLSPALATPPQEDDWPEPPPGVPAVAVLDSRPTPPEPPPGIPMVPSTPPPPPPCPAPGLTASAPGADTGKFGGLDREASNSSLTVAFGANSNVNLLPSGLLASEGFDLDLPFGAATELENPKQPDLARAVTVPTQEPLNSMPMPSLSRARSSPAGPLPPQPPTISQGRSSDGTCFSTRWTVDARKLKVKDKVAVSPSFELEGVSGTFRMMLHPTAVSERKGGASFKKAKGKGSVHIKCESALGEVYDGVVTLAIQVRSPNEEEAQEEAARGPLKHNFAESGIFSLPKDQEEWDFGKATDEETQNFVVLLEILDPISKGDS